MNKITFTVSGISGCIVPTGDGLKILRLYQSFIRHSSEVLSDYSPKGRVKKFIAWSKASISQKYLSLPEHLRSIHIPYEVETGRL